jgi:RNA polymerase sigma-70 factor (ECF subfamily)
MSFDEIYKNYYNELKRFGHQLNISADKSEDFVQETFLRFYLEFQKKVVFKNPRAWLYKVFLNLFKSDIRSARNKITDSEISVKGEVLAEDFQAEYSRNEKQRIVFEVLEKLDKKERELLLLYHNSFSYAEMAEILEMNPNSVGKTLVRTIEKLKVLLKTQYREMFE